MPDTGIMCITEAPHSVWEFKEGFPEEVILSDTWRMRQRQVKSPEKGSRQKVRPLGWQVCRSSKV